MFAKSQIETKLDDEIVSLLDKLENLKKDSVEYGAIVDRIAKLHKLKSEERPTLRPPSWDTVFAVAANIFGILWITRYERERVISTKSLGFIAKPRV